MHGLLLRAKKRGKGAGERCYEKVELKKGKGMGGRPCMYWSLVLSRIKHASHTSKSPSCSEYWHCDCIVVTVHCIC